MQDLYNVTVRDATFMRNYRLDSQLITTQLREGVHGAAAERLQRDLVREAHHRLDHHRDRLLRLLVVEARRGALGADRVRAVLLHHALAGGGGHRRQHLPLGHRGRPDEV